MHTSWFWGQPGVGRVEGGWGDSERVGGDIKRRAALLLIPGRE